MSQHGDTVFTTMKPMYTGHILAGSDPSIPPLKMPRGFVSKEYFTNPYLEMFYKQHLADSAKIQRTDNITFTSYI
jgi:hypothetical protein